MATPIEIFQKNIRQALKAKASILVAGVHGVGKTSIIREEVENLGYFCVDFNCATIDVHKDLLGLPVIEKPEGQGVFYTRTAYPIIFKNPEKINVFIVDEVNRTDPAMMNALMQLIYEHRLGELYFPNLVAVIAMYNPKAAEEEGDGYHVNYLDQAFITRFKVFLTAPLDLNRKHLRKKYPEQLANIFINWWDNILVKANAKEDEKYALRIHCVPRTLEYAMEMSLCGIPMANVIHAEPIKDQVAKLQEELNKYFTNPENQAEQILKTLPVLTDDEEQNQVIIAHTRDEQVLNMENCSFLIQKMKEGRVDPRFLQAFNKDVLTVFMGKTDRTTMILKPFVVAQMKKLDPNLVAEWGDIEVQTQLLSYSKTAQEAFSAQAFSSQSNLDYWERGLKHALNDSLCEAEEGLSVEALLSGIKSATTTDGKTCWEAFMKQPLMNKHSKLYLNLLNTPSVELLPALISHLNETELTSFLNKDRFNHLDVALMAHLIKKGALELGDWRDTEKLQKHLNAIKQSKWTRRSSPLMRTTMFGLTASDEDFNRLIFDPLQAINRSELTLNAFAEAQLPEQLNQFFSQ